MILFLFYFDAVKRKIVTIPPYLSRSRIIDKL
jgi:hypothetical protein